MLNPIKGTGNLQEQKPIRRLHTKKVKEKKTLVKCSRLINEKKKQRLTGFTPKGSFSQKGKKRENGAK